MQPMDKNAIFALFALILSALNGNVLGRGYRLYPHDQERLLRFLNICRADEDPFGPKLEWDETFNLENAAGLEASCSMIGRTSATWEWRNILKFSGHLKHFLKTKSLPNGLIGYAPTTVGDPWKTQWGDVKNIMATTWKEDLDVSMPLIMGAEKIGCSVLPNCKRLDGETTHMTVLVCVFSPGNGLLDMDTGPDPGRGDTLHGRRRRKST